MNLTGPVFVGSDLSAASDEALRQGQRLARDLESPLIVGHVVPELSMVDILFPQWAASDHENEKTLVDRARAAVESQLAATLPNEATNATIVVDSGSAHARLLFQAESCSAGVIVLGPGRTADRVVRHSDVPVLVARPSAAGVIVGATDFSDPSLPALDAAAFEARRRRASLHLLHVVDVGTYALAGVAGGGLPYLPGTPGIAAAAVDDMRAAAHQRLRATLHQFDIEGKAIAVSGPAAATIVTVAESSGAELIVVGTHGRTGLDRLTLGSTAEAVIRSARCSVLVVRLRPSRARDGIA